MSEMPEEVYCRALGPKGRKHLACVRPESPLIPEKEGGNMQYTRYIRADLVDEG